MNELIQEIITYLIITGTSFYTLYKTVLFFTPSQNKSSCSGCMGGSCGIKQTKISKIYNFVNIQKKGIILKV